MSLADRYRHRLRDRPPPEPHPDDDCDLVAEAAQAFDEALAEAERRTSS